METFNTVAVGIFPFYLVYTDDQNVRHHGLHTNIAPFVLTFSPDTGDRIFAAGSVRCLGGNQGNIQIYARIRKRDRRSLYIYHAAVVLSHPGRAGILGEDGLEEAYGHRCLLDLLREKIRYSYDATEPHCIDGEFVEVPIPPGFWLSLDGWEYAPVDAKVLDGEGDLLTEEESVTYNINDCR